MKKYFSLFLVAIFLFTGIKTVKADDGGPNGDFWAIDNTTHCASFINPEIAGKDAFLIFDYSPKVGEDRGKPWTIVEKGKCYEVDSGGEELYLIRIVNGNEREIFSNYNNYKSTDDIVPKFCKDGWDCNTTTLGHSIERIGFQGDIAVTTSSSEAVHFTGIETNTVFPTKYDFGDTVTFYHVMMPEGYEKIKPIVENKSFVEATNLYTSLSKQLNTNLQSCDNRIRVEDQYMFVYDKDYSYPYTYIKNVIWRASDNKDIVVKVFNGELNENGSPKSYGITELDSLRAIELMGCKSNFSSFIQAHKADFDKIDSLTDEVITKYPIALKKQSDIGVESIIILRDNSEIKKILEFVNNSKATEINTQVLQAQQLMESTVLDEPTLGKKMDLIKNSSNPFIKAYVWLPTVALFGILIVLILKKKKK